MKKPIRFLPLILSLGVAISSFTLAVFGSWETPAVKEKDIPYSETGSFGGIIQDPVCYINNTSNVYPTIEGALANAVANDFVVVIPPSDSITFPKDNADKRTDKSKFNPNDPGLAVNKVTYTIKKNCTIPEGVTLIIPYETVSSSMISSQNNFNNNYIKPMKKGTHESKGDSIFYQYTGNTKGSSLINFNSKYATENPNMFLRTTVEIASGVTLTNNGTIVVSGILSGGSGSGGIAGQTSHFYSKIIMGSNSHILQSNSSAKLYCFGYIEESSLSNSSDITIQNGSIYFPFIMNDCPEVFSTVALAKDGIEEYQVPPFNQYEIRNIEPKLTVKYTGKMIAMENLLVYSDNNIMSINKENPNDISFVGNDDGSFLQFNSSLSYAEFKYNKNTKLNSAHFYGGFNMNSLSITIEAVSGVPMTVSFDDAVFPMPYQVSITLSAANGQSGKATYNCGTQKMKLLPGSQLIIENGVDVTASYLAIYSAFFNKNANTNYTDVQKFSAQNYPLKDGAVCKVLGNSILNVSTIGGTVYADSDDNIVYSTGTISVNEAYWLTSNSGVYVRKFSKPLIIRERIQRYSLSDFSKNKLYIGVNALSTQNSYLASYSITFSDETSYTVNNGYQNVVLFDSSTSFKVGLVSNINTIYYRKGTTDVPYPKDSWVKTSESHIIDIIPSSLSIAQDEFDINSISLEAASDPVELDGVLTHGVLLSQSESLTAVINDYDKIYNRTVTFESSNASVLKIAKVNGNLCEVTGLSLGDATITATCDGMSSSLDFKVVESLENLIPIDKTSSGTYISDSSKQYRNQTKHTHTYGNNKNCNKTPDFTSSNTTGADIYHTFTLNVVPANANIQTVTWTFTGDTSYVKLVDSNRKPVSSLSNVYSVEMLQSDTTANGQADSSCLECTIVDKLDNTMTIYICVRTKNDSPLTCLLPQTTITMANNVKKQVKDIVAGDLVKVFNHETGEIDVAPITFNDCDAADYYNVVNLHFSNGSYVGVISEHGFFDLDTMKYEYIDETNYRNFIGHRFYNEYGDAVTLDRAYVDTQYTEVYSPTSFFHFNYFTEGLLSMPGGITGLFNIFDYADNLQYDQEAYARDIETYGLFTYEDLAPLGVTEIMFEAYAGKYLKVALGKGILTEEYLAYLIERYGGFTEY